MNLPVNAFKKAFADSQAPQLGVWNGLPDNYVAEILAGAGFDWILIDGEHSPFDLRTILHQLQAIARFNVPVLVRPPVGDPIIIKQLLDIGVETLLIPMVDTAQEAEQLFRATQYPPQGFRGVGAGLARAAQWNRIGNYLHEANEQICLMVQVENTAGLQNLDAILAVEGVDGIFIGPSDLAASMGHLGNYRHPDVMQAIENAIRTIRKAGKIAGVMATSKPLADHYISVGANMVAIAVDSSLLVKATSEVVDSYKATAPPTSQSGGY
ncbi:MAG: HpcH/HpaI aldolase/citrate lyase family protein [Spirosomataceae bacterium]